jgi:hypothetical protein
MMPCLLRQGEVEPVMDRGDRDDYVTTTVPVMLGCGLHWYV